MREIVYNSCFGGFGLSHKALKYLFENGSEYVKENPHFDPASDDWFNRRFPYLFDTSIDREDYLLVKVVKEMGKEANGDHADLRIAKIDGLYRIDEYDGAESVDQPNTYDWR